jgi:peptide/nickel transport system substrate-binding protein
MMTKIVGIATSSRFKMNRPIPVSAALSHIAAPVGRAFARLRAKPLAPRATVIHITSKTIEGVDAVARVSGKGIAAGRRVRAALLALAGLWAPLAAAPAVAAPKDTIVFAVRELPPTLGNPFGANGTPSSYVWMAMFDGLVKLNPEGALAPALATAWEAVSPTEWKFTLRSGVLFSNGEPFDAEAAAATINWLTTPEGRRTVIGNELRDVTAAAAQPDGTLVVRTSVPDAILPNRLVAAFIVAPKAWAALGPEGFARNPAGTGPFKVDSWSPSKIELSAFPGSWRAPKVARLEVLALKENSSRFQALVTGTSNITQIDIEDVDRIDTRQFYTLTSPSTQVMTYSFVTAGKTGPLTDVRVRQALNYAVDKQALADVLLRGLAKVASQPAASSAYGYNPAVEPYAYDPAKARALLAEAGVGKDFALKVDVVVGSVPADGAIYQTVADFLRQVGVEVELNQMPFPAWLRNYLSGNFDGNAFGLSLNSLPYGDSARSLEIASCLRSNPFFCDETLTAKIEASNRELDAAKRLALLQELNAAYRDAAPVLYLVEQFDLFGVDRTLQNVSIANRVPEWEKITLAP